MDVKGGENCHRSLKGSGGKIRVLLSCLVEKLRVVLRKKRWKTN